MMSTDDDGASSRSLPHFPTIRVRSPPDVSAGNALEGVTDRRHVAQQMKLFRYLSNQITLYYYWGDATSVPIILNSNAAAVIVVILCCNT